MSEEIMRIRLGKSVKFAIIDAEDWDIVKDYYWRLDVRGYVSGEFKKHKSDRSRKRHMRIHRLVMGAKNGEIIDHIFGDKLDNRKCSLRVASVSENNQNRKPKTRSGYKGVHPSSRNQKNPFWSTMTANNKRKFLGYFQNAYDAAIAYDDAIIKSYGDRAKHQFLNFPERALGKINKATISKLNLFDPPGTQTEFAFI